jgi:glycosyltransferase involved in cell wall biosynthesis
MNKKKLCLIYNTAPRYREAIFRAIDAEYDCDWYFGPKHGDIKEMDMSKLKHVHRIRQFGNPNRILVKFGMLRLLFKEKYQTYFMLAETRSITDWLFFWLAHTFFPKKKVYIWTHGWYGKETGMDAKMKLWLYRHVTGTFVYGDRAKELLIKEGIPSEKIFAIHNSLDYDEQLKIRMSIDPSNIYSKHFGNNNPTIIFIGRLTKVKRLDMIIEAVANLKKKGEHYNVVLIGEGVEGESLRIQVKSLGLDDAVWFYGASYDEKTNAELIYNADLCVSPGNIGLTVIHVLMFGCPAISHNDLAWQMPEVEAIKIGETGNFFERDNVESLADSISGWFADKKNNREEVRQACYNEIDANWNPYYQIEVINKHLR